MSMDVSRLVTVTGSGAGAGAVPAESVTGFDVEEPATSKEGPETKLGTVAPD
jgi:hypothetical protein